MLVTKLFHDTRNKPTLAVDFTEQIDFTVAGSNYNSGYRGRSRAVTFLYLMPASNMVHPDTIGTVLVC
ncbi:MAG: hypothetical protein JNL70_02630 [Saprospiraceae bacterium]|nr:hypothetical protein [Saprospiraceae bacterium]